MSNWPFSNINAVPSPELSGGNSGDSLTQKDFEDNIDFQFEDNAPYDFENP